MFVQNTKHLLPSELEILADPPPAAQNYNCFLYVFGLYKDSEILEETNGFIYDTFVQHVLRTGELTPTENPHNGDYVVYQDLKHYPDALTHIGVLHDNKVISKWAWGPLVRHSLWDVPTEYGNNVFYITAISPARARTLYHTYKAYNTHPSAT